MKLLLLTFSMCIACACVAQHTPSAPGTDSLLQKDAIRIWPNPAINDVYITIRQEGVIIHTLFLFDHRGHILMEKKINYVLASPIKISVSHLQPGNYFMVFNTNKQPARLQLVKN